MRRVEAGPAARMERSVIRDSLRHFASPRDAGLLAPDYASLHPGYGLRKVPP
jgi:hypothetical protein